MIQINLLILGILSISNAFASHPESFTLNLHGGTPVTAAISTPAEEPKAVALILQGSGNVAYDGDVSSPFLGQGYKGAPAKLSNQLAETLASSGILSLRYSKRGVDNAAELPNQTIDFLIKDAIIAFDYLKQNYPGKKIFVYGMSEGAILSLHIAKHRSPDALFILSLPAASIDETLAYQFAQWPVEQLSAQLDMNKDGNIDPVEINSKPGALTPIVFQTIDTLDLDKNGTVSIESEAAPYYQAVLGQIMKLADSPDFKPWYQSMKKLEPVSETLSAVKNTNIYAYAGKLDAQTRVRWIQELNLPVQIFDQLGHCFSPMDGAIGEVKTSGPLADSLLQAISKDSVAAVRR